MAVISNWLAIDRVHGFALHKSAVTVDRACTFVANAGDSDAANGEMGSSDGSDLAAVAGGIVQADDVRHGGPLSHRARPTCNQRRPTLEWLRNQTISNRHR